MVEKEKNNTNGNKIRSWIAVVGVIAVLLVALSGGGFDIIPFSRGKVDAAQDKEIAKKLDKYEFEKFVLSFEKTVDLKINNSEKLYGVYLESIDKQLIDIKKQMEEIDKKIEKLRQ